MTWPALGKRWSDAEIAADVAEATGKFRARRLAEPLDRYTGEFDSSVHVSRELIEQLGSLLTSAEADPKGLKRLWTSEAGRTAFRYLGAPPISDDDLETLAGVRLAASAAQAADGKGSRLVEVMLAILDPRRFPWVGAGRPPTEGELHAAVLATATMIASQRVETLRRGEEKALVEGSVKNLMLQIGWVESPRKPNLGIQNLLNDSPAPKTFLTQVNLGADNADVVVRLGDGRLLAIECKGSNSEINSRKRLNKEAAQNARAWLGRFGDQVVPAVALQGVFKDRYVAEAQATPMLIFWGHRLDDLRRFVESAG